jgi:LuxR family maltose regulon positive regulatory protein
VSLVRATADVAGAPAADDDDRRPGRHVMTLRSQAPTTLAAPRIQREPAVVSTLPSALPFDVLASKLARPDVRSGVASRTGLVNRLRGERSLRIATVVAAAGYGKTTLLAQWAERDERPFAWLSVDAHDNDPLLLLRHLAAAFHRIEPLDASVADALASPKPALWSAAMPRLAAAMASSPPFVAVLDDADRVRVGESAEILVALADAVPDGSMLVLAGRQPPPLPVACLRASGRLLELGARDLAFDRREARIFVERMGLALEDADAADLLARTEGWPAGMYLATRAGLDAKHSRRVVVFGGGNRHIRDYFRSECLSGLTTTRLAFLRRTAVLERLSASLCDAVLESNDSATELEAIERENLFLVPLDREGTWYRYHGLFRDILRHELDQHEPELVPVLSRRAADWYETRGDLEAALPYAAASADADRAARILTTIALPAYGAGRATTLESRLAQFDADAPLDAYPAVAATGGFIHAQLGHAAESERWLAEAESGMTRAALTDDAASTRAEIALLRATLCADGVERMERDVEAALAELAADNPWRPTALLLRGVARALQGDGDAADRALAAAADAAATAGATATRLVAIGERSLLAAARDDPVMAATLALEARELLAQGALADYPSGALAHAVAARALLRQGRWGDARGELAAAERLATSLTHAEPWLAVQTRLVLGDAYVTLRDRNAAYAQLAEGEKLLELRPHLGALVGQIDGLRRQIEELPEPRGSHRAGLTGAELRLLPLLATHLSFREIGDQLYVSRNTVKTQAISVYRKLGVSSRSAAIGQASELGLLEPSTATGHPHGMT